MSMWSRCTGKAIAEKEAMTRWVARCEWLFAADAEQDKLVGGAVGDRRLSVEAVGSSRAVVKRLPTRRLEAARRYSPVASAIESV
jgi:hypothetical protein